MSRPKLKPSPLIDQTYAELKRMIMNGDLEPGQRINIDRVADDLGVSHTPIREVLSALVPEGLVQYRPHRGYNATPKLTEGELRDLFDLRLLIEPWAAAQAAKSATAADRRALLTELERCESPPSDEGYDGYRRLTDHDHRLHDSIMHLSGNASVREAWLRTNCHLHVFRHEYSESMGHETIDEHFELVSGIVAGSEEQASAAMSQHIKNALDRLLDRFTDT